MKLCCICKETKSLTDFYKNRNKTHGCCKSCWKRKIANKRIQFKLDMIAYRGGSCQKCGYNRFYGALDFHHLDPSKKDFSLSEFRFRGMNDIIKKELDKCILLCSNCHRELHGNKMSRQANGLSHHSFTVKITGSIPVRDTKIKLPFHLAVWVRDFESRQVGSTPTRATKYHGFIGQWQTIRFLI